MKKTWEYIKKGCVFIWNHREFLFAIVIVILIVFLVNKCSSVRNLENENKRLQNNIEAANDTIRNYKDAYNNSCADIRSYQFTEKELNNRISKLVEKNKSLTSYIETNLGIHDTVYIEKPVVIEDSTQEGYAKSGQIKYSNSETFGKSSREISVTSDYRIDSLYTLQVDGTYVELKQNINVEAYMDVDKDRKSTLHLRSDYPNLVFNSGEGITVTSSKEYDKQQRKTQGISLFVGPALNLGYDVVNKTFSPSVGVSIGIGWTYTPRFAQW